MIHGVGLDHTMWGPQMPALEEAFCVLRYDMLGHGQSEARPVKDITTFVQQLEDLLSYLDIKKMHLVVCGSVDVRGYFFQKIRYFFQKIVKNIKEMEIHIFLLKKYALVPKLSYMF